MSIRLDRNNFAVIVDDKAVELTPTEWRLLTYLVENRERVIGKTELIEKVWGSGAEATRPSTVEVYIKYLRNKVSQELILTRMGFGYKFNPDLLPVDNKNTNYNPSQQG